MRCLGEVSQGSDPNVDMGSDPRGHMGTDPCGRVGTDPVASEGTDHIRGDKSASVSRRSGRFIPLLLYRERLQPVTTTSRYPAEMKPFARAIISAGGIETDGPRKCGIMQNAHFPLQPS